MKLRMYLNACCCPREGYKVASNARMEEITEYIRVAVPVRGIRLHLRWFLKDNTRFTVTVPVRGIRLHLKSETVWL